MWRGKNRESSKKLWNASPAETQRPNCVFLCGKENSPNLTLELTVFTAFVKVFIVFSCTYMSRKASGVLSFSQYDLRISKLKNHIGKKNGDPCQELDIHNTILGLRRIVFRCQGGRLFSWAQPLFLALLAPVPKNFFYS